MNGRTQRGSTAELGMRGLDYWMPHREIVFILVGQWLIPDLSGRGWCRDLELMGTYVKIPHLLISFLLKLNKTLIVNKG